jgi:hypothetical protein
MFGRDGDTKTTVAETADSVRKTLMDAADAIVDYVDPLARDEKLRKRIAAAIVAGSAARQRVRKQTGVTGLARRIGSDPVLRAQMIELGTQLQEARRRAKKARTHRLRNSVLLVSGVAIAIAAVPAAREKLMSVVRMRQDERTRGSWPAASAATDTTIEKPTEGGEMQGEREHTQKT